MIEAGTRVTVVAEGGRTGQHTLMGKLVQDYDGTNETVVLDRYGATTIIPGARVIYVEVERERVYDF